MNQDYEAQFREWAVGFSGIPGGNPKGALWFCGIEYGGLDDEISFEEPLQQTHKSIPCWDDKTEVIEGLSGHRLQYDYKCAKVACAYFGIPLTAYKDYFLHKLYWHNGATFKLNLYPLAFPNTDAAHWREELKSKIGFGDKAAYREWCAQHRFPFLKKLVTKYRPEVLICTGVTYEQAFKTAFMDEPVLRDETALDDKGKRRCKLFTTNQHKTKLIVTPFFGGPHGLNSDEHLERLGRYARKEQ
ncbi:MAG: hypothetical protein LRY36_02600 [Alphaproteobacteria bacterium]|nr:hypothetical protein [Alphaproteobacteria bacterium]